MALKDTWVDKIDGVDDASAEDINEVAHAVIDLEVNGGSGGSITIDTEMSDTSENAVQNKVIKAYIQDYFSLDQIIDPDNNPITESSEITVDFVMETGTLDSTGVDTDSPTQIRSDFISVTSGSGIIYASLEWDEDLRIIGYNADKVFVEKKYTSVGSKFTIPDTWAYLRFYTGATDAQFTFVTGTPETKAEFKKIYFADHGYSIYGAPIDDETMHKLVVKAEGKDGNSFNIIEVKAPPENPEEATIALMNWGNGIKQFVDLSSMVYSPDNPTVEIVCQTRGGYKLPEFSVRFNDGQGAGRVKKFVVHPDAIPIEMTSSGLKVRKNNTYDNNGADEDYVTINLVEMESEIKSVSNEVDVLKKGGLNGADGHTPVKGIDYWTDDDKAEIVADVLAALPAAEEVAY